MTEATLRCRCTTLEAVERGSARSNAHLTYRDGQHTHIFLVLAHVAKTKSYYLNLTAPTVEVIAITSALLKSKSISLPLQFFRPNAYAL